MIYFPPLQMRRFTAKIREISIAQSLSLASIPTHLDEMAATAFLRACVEDAPLDPAYWTVQERIMGVAHYLSSTADSPNFTVGDHWHFADYFMPEANERKAASEWFECSGDAWRAVPILGRFAESAERLSGEIEGVTGRAHWVFAMLAAGLERKNGEDGAPGDDSSDHDIDAWMLARMKVFADYPESDFIALMTLANTARAEIDHLFRIRPDDAGIVAMPNTEGAGIPPARFPVRSALGDWSKAMAGKPE